MTRPRVVVEPPLSTAPSIPSVIARVPLVSRGIKWAAQNLNFYRLHLLWFTVVPLIASGIFFASNGTNKIPYIDCLFMIVSPMTMTGLETVLMASLTLWQQVLMYLMMIIGSMASVSIVMILVRLHYFRKKFCHVARQRYPAPRAKPKRNPGEPIRLEMIRRVLTPPSEIPPPPFDGKNSLNKAPSAFFNELSQTEEPEELERQDASSLGSATGRVSPHGVQFPNASLVRHRTNRTGTESEQGRTFFTHPEHVPRRTRTLLLVPQETAESFGGFPNPLKTLSDVLTRRAKEILGLDKHLTIAPTTTLASAYVDRQHPVHHGAKLVHYITFDATVGRNSNFSKLSPEEEEELGGVEYRALSLLLRVVVAYWFAMQLVAVLILAPWLSTSGTYKPVFDDPGTVVVNPTWFVFFQVQSAFSNDGLSLVDANMVPFGNAYLLQIVMGFLILGGNTAYPIFLRIIIWTMSKMVPKKSRTHETLHFLLDHPRRCFIYLFPSYQTWFLVFVLAALDFADWASFLILDIGNPDIGSIPVHTRVLNGLFQALSVRSGGFAVVSLSTLAPAVSFLYVVMMYIGVYPIAISIRSTNVYEERSMGIFDEDLAEDDDDAEARFNTANSTTSYLAFHIRRQLAFDMWWLVLAVFIICIIERHAIEDDASPWITVFTIMFEISSAYGTVGLSLGTPNSSTSLSGDLRKLSKLVIIFVMIRGRHRGLPIAIDRAVMLPSDANDDDPGDPTENLDQEEDAGGGEDSPGEGASSGADATG